MGGNGSEGLGDDFFEQILAVPEASYGRSLSDVGSMQMGLQLGSNNGGDVLRGEGSLGIRVGMPLGLNLEQGAFMRHQQGHDVEGNITNSHTHNQHHQQQLLHLNHNGNNNNNNTSQSSSSNAGINDKDMQMRGMFSGFGQLHNPPHTHAHAQSIRPTLLSPHPQLHHHHQPFQSQTQPPMSVAAMPQHPPGIRPRVRARRGQATDPHSIAERLRRERIAERMKALQELVPSINKTDRAIMLDEIMEYVKFLRLQVKVLSMSRLGGAGAVAQLVSDVPFSAVEGEDNDGADEQTWEKWSNDGTEEQVAKLMEEDVGAAMQFLQSKALCIMPISLASTIFRMPQSEPSSLIKPESNNS
ncbi:hypothetical protein TanjilG_10124 [Lupinus angustifolius]|uniref:BHLH domain-containing protein n=1 Tax=Lupinus angustifolius TaxID=3871 RepID=A0A1J7H2P7_LUPAN|nr:PREDICTED: transcription factor UNE12-like isoform X2 [Lupinus angustifolius]OIW07151.1 hypothetical protein TanjilG_10124 [Lupinus angustifolius]